MPQWLRAEHASKLPEVDSDQLWRQESSGPRWWSWLAWTLTKGRAIDEMPDYVVRRAKILGLDARTPLLDIDLVELVLRLPPELAFDAALDRPVARAATRGVLPDVVRLRKDKSNYAGFIHDALLGGDLPWIRMLFRGPKAEIRRYVASEHIERLISNPPRRGEAGWFDWGPEVWGLLTTECWLRFQAGETIVELPPPRWGSSIVAQPIS